MVKQIEIGNFVLAEKEGNLAIIKNGKTILQFTEKDNTTKILNGKGNQLISINLNGDVAIGSNFGNITTMEEFKKIPVGLTFFLRKPLGGNADNKVYFKGGHEINDIIVLN